MIYSAGKCNATPPPPHPRYQEWMAHFCTLLLPVLLHPSGRSTLRAHLQDGRQGNKMRGGKVQWNQFYLFSPYSKLKLVRAGEQIKILTIFRKCSKWTSSQCLLASKNKHQSQPKVKPIRHLLPSPLHGLLLHLLAMLWSILVVPHFRACWQAKPLCQALLHCFIWG